jgi:hypothetical protein
MSCSRAYLPLWWGETLAASRVVDLTAFGVVEGTLVGLLVYDLGAWARHRAMPRWRPLCLAFHPMHHSAERLDVWGAFSFSPLDMLGWTLLGSRVPTVVVGLAPQAVTAVLPIATLRSMVEHANLRTPRWPGWRVQRPESQPLHPARGVRARVSRRAVHRHALRHLAQPDPSCTRRGLLRRRVGTAVAGADVGRCPRTRAPRVVTAARCPTHPR